MANENAVVKTLMAMSTIMRGGDRVTPEAASLMLDDLKGYSDEQLLSALTQCRKELQFFPSVSEIIARINDGRPGIEEAWSLAPKSDASASYLNQEIMTAWKVASDLLRDGGDMIAARMAFKEVYERTVKENRANGLRPKWWLSRAFGMGSDLSDQAALRDAVEKRRISEPQAVTLLPEFKISEAETKILPQSSEIQKLISNTFKKPEEV